MDGGRTGDHGEGHPRSGDPGAAPRGPRRDAGPVSLTGSAEAQRPGGPEPGAGGTVVKVTPSAGLVAVTAAVGLVATGGARGLGLWVVFVGLWLGSVLVHEGGHLWAARRRGVDVDHVRVGIATSSVHYGTDVRALGAGGVVAVCMAGPVASLAVGGIAAAVAVVLPGGPGDGPGFTAAVFSALNALHGVVNLIPVGGTDGHLAVTAVLGSRRETGTGPRTGHVRGRPPSCR